MVGIHRIFTRLMFLSMVAGIFFCGGGIYSTSIAQVYSNSTNGDYSGQVLLNSFGWVKCYWDDDILLLRFDNVEPGSYQLYEMEDPPRIVLDLPDIKAPSADAEYQEAYDFDTIPLVNQLRANYGTEQTRIVLETKFPVYWEIISPDTANYLEVKCLIRFRQTLEEIAIDSGTTYVAKRYVTPSGQRFIHAVICDQTKSRLRPRVVTASDVTTRNLASVRTIVEGSRAAAGINGGYFTWPGISVSLVVQNGVITAPPMMHRPAFMVLQNNSMMIGYPDIRGTVTAASGVSWDIDVINEVPGPGETALLTPGHPSRLRNDLASNFALLTNGSVECVTCDEVEDLTGKFILWPRRQYPSLTMLADGEPVDIDYQMVNTVNSPVNYAIQGGPFLVKNGRIDVTSEENDIGRDIAVGRSARTAIGFNDEGILYLVIVENSSSQRSIGASLSELAWTMVDLGATWAMNLDGGSSSGMALGFSNTEIVIPDSGRQVATAVILIDESGRLQGSQFYF